MNQDQSEVVVKRRGRGPSKKGSLTYVGIRVEKDVLEFLNQFPNRQAVIRDALKTYVEQFKKEQEHVESN